MRYGAYELCPSESGVETPLLPQGQTRMSIRVPGVIILIHEDQTNIKIDPSISLIKSVDRHTWHPDDHFVCIGGLMVIGLYPFTHTIQHTPNIQPSRSHCFRSFSVSGGSKYVAMKSLWTISDNQRAVE
jgi:hypothetical protein